MTRRSTVGLAAVVALSLFPPATALGGQVGGVTYTPGTWAGGATTSWVVRFQVLTDMLEGTITVKAPPGTVLSHDPADYTLKLFWDGAYPRAPTAATVTDGGRTVTLKDLTMLGWNVLIMRDVKNPPPGTDGRQLSVATSLDTIPSPPAAGPGGPDGDVLGRGAGNGVFTAPNSLGRLTMSSSSRVAGGLATWTYDFATSPLGALSAGSGTISLFGHSGTRFPLSAASYRVNGAAVTGAPSLSQGGRVATVTSPVDIGPQAPVTVVVAGVTNPLLEGLHGNTAYGASTSADGPVSRAPNIAIAGSPPPTSVQGLRSDVDPLGRLVVRFFTSGSAGRLGGGDVITLSSHDTSCYTFGTAHVCGPLFSTTAAGVYRCMEVLNATTGANAFPCAVLNAAHTVAKLYLPRFFTASPGDEIAIGGTLQGVGIQKVSVSTTTDPVQATAPLTPVAPPPQPGEPGDAGPERH